MTFLKHHAIAIIALIGVVVLSFVAFGGGSAVKLSGFDRTTFENPVTFSESVTLASTTAANLIAGKGIFATSTTGTLTETQLLANTGISITAAGAGQAVLALTLPATSTMTTLIATKGSCKTWHIDASAVAAATTTTIVAGAGWNLVGLDATGAGTGADVIDGAEYGQLTACRETDTDVVGYVSEWIHAD